MHAQNTESASADGKFIKWYSVRTLPQSSGQFSESNICMLFWYTEDAVSGAISGSLASRCRLQGTGIEPITFLTLGKAWVTAWREAVIFCVFSLILPEIDLYCNMPINPLTKTKKNPTWYSGMINVKNLDYTNQCIVNDSRNNPPPNKPFPGCCSRNQHENWLFSLMHRGCLGCL